LHQKTFFGNLSLSGQTWHSVKSNSTPLKALSKSTVESAPTSKDYIDLTLSLHY